MSLLTSLALCHGTSPMQRPLPTPQESQWPPTSWPVLAAALFLPGLWPSAQPLASLEAKAQTVSVQDEMWPKKQLPGYHGLGRAGVRAEVLAMISCLSMQ